MRLCRCGAITKKGLCDKCKPPRPKQTQTTKQRGYGHDWRTFSEYQRENRPICEVCDAEDKVRPATELHHIEKIRLAPSKRLDVSNTVAVCSQCHLKIEGMGRTELNSYLENLRKEA